MEPARRRDNYDRHVATRQRGGGRLTVVAKFVHVPQELRHRVVVLREFPVENDAAECFEQLEHASDSIAFALVENKHEAGPHEPNEQHEVNEHLVQIPSMAISEKRRCSTRGRCLRQKTSSRLWLDFSTKSMKLNVRESERRSRPLARKLQQTCKTVADLQRCKKPAKPSKPRKLQ